MIYDIKRFDVTAGTPVRIRLTNYDAMPHNLLVCKPGSMRKVGTKENVADLVTKRLPRPKIKELMKSRGFTFE